MGRPGHCRQHMLDVGLTVLSSKGYNATSVKDVVSAAEVPKGSFYNHFDSKQAFVIEALEKLADESIVKAKAILSDTSLSPKLRLFQYFEVNFQYFKDNAFKCGCLVGNICLEMSDEDPEIRNATNQIMKRHIQLISDCLNSAKSANELAEETDPQQLAEFIYCSWEGTLMRMKSTKSSVPFEIFFNQIKQYFNH